MSEQNHGKSWAADVMIRNAKALQRVVKELEKNRPKPSPSDGWSKWDRGTEDQLLFKGKFLAVPYLLSLATDRHALPRKLGHVRPDQWVSGAPAPGRKI